MGIFAAVPAYFAARKATTKARRDYFAAERQVGAALAALAYTTGPLERWALLQDAARHATTVADVHPAAFGVDPDEDGRDLADSHRHAATLYQLLAAVENSLHLGFCTVPMTAERADLPESEAELIEVAHDVLCEMVAERDISRRYRLLEELYADVVLTIGGQAAEALWCLPGPDFIGWTTRDERDAWIARVSPQGGTR